MDALLQFEHKLPPHPQDALSKNTNYYERLQRTLDNNPPTPATTADKLLFQQVVGVFLSYARAVHNIMLMALNFLAL